MRMNMAQLPHDPEHKWMSTAQHRVEQQPNNTDQPECAITSDIPVIAPIRYHPFLVTTPFPSSVTFSQHHFHTYHAATPLFSSPITSPQHCCRYSPSSHKHSVNAHHHDEIPATLSRRVSTRFTTDSRRPCARCTSPSSPFNSSASSSNAEVMSFVIPCNVLTPSSKTSSFSSCCFLMS